MFKIKRSWLNVQSILFYAASLIDDRKIKIKIKIFFVVVDFILNVANKIVEFEKDGFKLRKDALFKFSDFLQKIKNIL